MLSSVHQLLSGTPRIPSILPERPITIVRHSQEEWGDLREIRFSVLDDPAICICTDDLADVEAIY
jgi:hypothetical protein